MLILLGLSLHASHSSRLKKAGVGLAPSVSRMCGLPVSHLCAMLVPFGTDTSFSLKIRMQHAQ